MIGKMKKLNQIVIITMLMLPFTVTAQQRGNGPGNGGNGDQIQRRDGSGMMAAIPDLTAEQQDKIKTIHLNMMKESLPIKNKLGENKAKMKTLQTADNPDMKAINTLIDESAKLEADLKKKRAANHQEVRKLLTDEQRVIFDSRSGQMRARADRQGRGAERGERGIQRRQRFHQDDGDGK